MLAVLYSGFHAKAIFDKRIGVLIDMHVKYVCCFVHAKFAVELRIGMAFTVMKSGEASQCPRYSERTR